MRLISLIICLNLTGFVFGAEGEKYPTANNPCAMLDKGGPKKGLLESLNEWQTDAHMHLFVLLGQTKKTFNNVMSKKATQKELNQVQEHWITLQSLLPDPNYEEKFATQNNYAKVGFKQDLPLEIVVGVDKPEEVTVQKAQLYFEKLKAISDKIKREEEIEDEERQALVALYVKIKQQQQADIELPDHLQDTEAFIQALSVANHPELKDKTSHLMKVMRQGNSLSRDPVYVELYKASKKGQLLVKAGEYRNAMEELKLDTTFVMNIPIALKMAAEGENLQVEELLKDERITPPEDHGPIPPWQRTLISWHPLF